MSIFDIIGPVMVGPSSSHTAGALRLARVARRLLAQPVAEAEIVLFGSFADTYKGHGTDRAVLAGLLDFAPEDPRIPESYKWADEAGMEYVFTVSKDQPDHPNTLQINLKGKEGRALTLVGRSIGGGNIVVTQVNAFSIEYTGKMQTLIVMQNDVPGVVAAIAGSMYENGINIATMRVYRDKKGGRAVTIMETDEPLPGGLEDKLRALPNIRRAIVLPKIED